MPAVTCLSASAGRIASDCHRYLQGVDRIERSVASGQKSNHVTVMWLLESLSACFDVKGFRA
jgi:hypothetical protein